MLLATMMCLPKFKVSIGFTNCRSSGIFTTSQPSPGFMGLPSFWQLSQKEKRSNELQMCGEKCLVVVSGVRGQTAGWRPQQGDRNWDNPLVKIKICWTALLKRKTLALERGAREKAYVFYLLINLLRFASSSQILSALYTRRTHKINPSDCADIPPGVPR